MKYIGLDGCKSGWFFVALDDASGVEIGILSTIAEIEPLLDLDSTVLIDIPIGLRSSGSLERLCDKHARKLLGPKRGSSVFRVPCRTALTALDYQQASTVNFENTGKKLSKQTWGIVAKIREVDDYIRRSANGVLPREMHPELCFCALNLMRPLKHNKKTDQGFAERIDILCSYFAESERVVSLGLSRFLRKVVARDDIVDALVGAVTAKLPLISLPQHIEIDGEGLQMEIVYADV
ncbi:MAG: DUF429 domain-containing protein [Pseudomonadales bacterium]